MPKLKKRDIKKALKELMFEAAPLSTNKGKLIRIDHCPNKVNSKTRRHKGWVTSRWAGPGKYKEALIDEGLDPVYFYDEWESVHDGIHYDPDRTHIRSEFMSGGGSCRNCSPSCKLYETCSSKNNPVVKINEKLKKHEEIRKIRKEKSKQKRYYGK